MNGIMHAAIHKVAQHKAGEKHKCGFGYHQVLKTEYSRCEDNTWYRRHKKAFPVARILMVIAMHDVYKLTRLCAVCHPVKSEAMHEVFKKGPENHPDDKNENYIDHGEAQNGSAAIKHITDNREVDPPDYKRVSFGEHFQVCVLKQLSLPLIVYLFEFHPSPIWTRKYEEHS